MFIILIVLAAFIVIGGLLFRIKNVDCEIISVQPINLKESVVQKISDKYSGQSILYLSLSDAKKEIEQEFKYAKVQKIEKQFPGTLVFSISERYELFAVKNKDGKYNIFDIDLFQIRTADNAGGDKLITVSNYAEKYSNELLQVVQTLLECQKDWNILQMPEVIQSIDFADGKCKVTFCSQKFYSFEIDKDFTINLKKIFNDESKIF